MPASHKPLRETPDTFKRSCLFVFFCLVLDRKFAQRGHVYLCLVLDFMSRTRRIPAHENNTERATIKNTLDYSPGCPGPDMFPMSNRSRAWISWLQKSTRIQKDVLANNMYIYTMAIQCFQTTGTLQKQQNIVRRRAFPVRLSRCHCGCPSTTWAPSSVKSLGPSDTEWARNIMPPSHPPYKSKCSSAIVRLDFFMDNHFKNLFKANLLPEYFCFLDSQMIFYYWKICILKIFCRWYEMST